MASNITRAVFVTLFYYDGLDMPLTAFEAYRYLITPVPNSSTVLTINFIEGMGFVDVLTALDELRVSKIIEEKWGYYFLSRAVRQGSLRAQSRPVPPLPAFGGSSSARLTVNSTEGPVPSPSTSLGVNSAEGDLPVREALVPERIRRIKIADQKWKKARRAVRWLAAVPFLRAVFASGSLAMQNTDVESDLDILLVAKHGRIFTVRFFVTAILFLLRAYRHGPHIADRVCPNHYVTDTTLAIPFKSLFNAANYAHLVPVLLRDAELPQKFFLANEWMGDYLTNAKLTSSMDSTSPSILKSSGLNSSPQVNFPQQRFGQAGQEMKNKKLSVRRIRQVYRKQTQDGQYKIQNQRMLKQNFLVTVLAMGFEFILNGAAGDFLESVLRNMQLARIVKNPATKNPGSGHVVVNNDMLAFHPHSNEQVFLDKFNEKCKIYLAAL